MSNTLFISLAVLGILGGVLAVVLYFVAQKFKVEENPLIDEAEACLPGANCGGCGFAGCRALAEACVKQAAEKGNIDGLSCPGTDMGKVAAVLGLTAAAFEPKIAVVRCNGSCQNSPSKVHYEGADICAFANTLYAGEGGCSKGCLGLGDCVKKCNFDAIHIDKETGLPVVDPDKCVGCGVCAKNERPPRVCVLRQYRQGRIGHEKLLGGLHRLPEVPERVPLRGHRNARQPGIHRPGQVQGLRQVRESVPTRQHPRHQLPRSQAGNASPARRRTRREATAETRTRGGQN